MIVKMVVRQLIGIGLIMIGMLFSSAPAQAGMPIFDNRYELLPVGDEVRDWKTKLIWQRCLVGQEWNGARCVGSPHKFTFAQARKLEEGGWRIPNKMELESILDQSGIKPTIHRRAFLGAGGNVWTSSSAGSVAYLVWATSFDYGFSYSALRGNGLYVRLVRG